MVPDKNDDDRTATRDPRGDAGRHRRGPRLILALAIVVFGASLAFVLVYSTDLSWPSAVLIGVALAGGQAYALRRILFPGDGHDGTDR